MDQVTESSGGIRRVRKGEIDHLTAVEGTQSALSSRRASPGRLWSAWPGTEVIGGVLSVAVAPR